jgi:hypothetical protein
LWGDFALLDCCAEHDDRMGRLSAHKLSPGDVGTGPERSGGSGCGWGNGRSRDDTRGNGCVEAADNGDEIANDHVCRNKNYACSYRYRFRYHCHGPRLSPLDQEELTSRRVVQLRPKFSKISFVFSFSSATSFVQIVLSIEQPMCHWAPRANPLILPRLVARLLDSQPVKITGGERNCWMIPSSYVRKSAH